MSIRFYRFLDISKQSANETKGVQERDKSEGMGCTQREPFVLYNYSRKEAIVNRCEERKII